MARAANQPTVQTHDLPAARRRGLALAEVLALVVLGDATVVAGRSGLDRRVERVGVLESLGDLGGVRPCELVLTSGLPLRDASAGELRRLVPGLVAGGAAALALPVGRHVDAVPPVLLAEADRQGLPVLALPADAELDDVLEEVLTAVLNPAAAALSRSEEVHRALLQIVVEGGGLPEVSAGLVGLLGGAVVITTPDGRVLADAGDVTDLAEAYRGTCFNPSGRLRTEDEIVGLSRHAGLRGNHVVVRIAAGRTDHGRIVAFSSRGALTADDVPTVERAATVAALAVTKQLAVRAVESKYQGDFLRDLLTGQVGPEVGVAHAASLGWDVDRPVVVVVAELDPYEGEDQTATLVARPAGERFAAAWQTVVRPRDPQAPVVGFHREVVAVLGAPVHGDVDRLVRELVREVSGDGGGGRRSFGTGVSRVAARPDGLPRAYEQARTAVRVGRRVQGKGSLAHFDGLGVFRLLSLVQDDAELRAFAEETLGALAQTGGTAQERQENADLRHTLEVLLDANLNVAEAARRLHFHYNTLRYRIAKLERMLGPFAEDPQLRLSLHVALQILQMRDA
jgi:PucR family transcriptional regulator, purine catabolism regulatory protein